MENSNYFKLEFEAKNVNESFARGVVAMFAAELKPTLSEINDLKTAVSEAVTNSIVHGYNGNGGKVVLETKISGNK
jgi:stage II sporulation protein AB (anti-sigma F factor)